MQVTDGKEHIITYLSRRLIDAKTRYSFIVKLCLSLFYACSKLRHYLLSSTCVAACQVNVIKGKCVGVVLVSPRGAVFETSTHLKYFCTNNQAEYEVILLGLQILSSMGGKHVESFGDSLLVVQQVASIYQCFNGSLNAYLDKCLKIIDLFNNFIVQDVFRDDNIGANNLA
jgi:hypothetical protein